MSKSRKSKVIAIPLEEPNGLAEVQKGDQEVKTDAEQMSDLINVISRDDIEMSEVQISPDDTPKDDTTEYVEVKRKRERAPARPRKAKVAEPVPDINVITTDERQMSDFEPSQDDTAILTTEYVEVKRKQGRVPPLRLRRLKADLAPEPKLEPEPEPPPPKAPPLRRLKTIFAPEPVPEPDPEPEPESPQEEVNQDVKSIEKVECTDCGKKMSAKTLKYSHAANCTVRKKRNQEHNLSEVTKDLIENEISKRMNSVKEERAARRQKAIDALIANAF